ncbi:MAG: CPBP family intramembrane metalloprotease [Thermanaeromonas sp.]|uniref:CPBP family intramembrane glutamic endopeptidase n=1 Tax=Thermanaeromonas sp. TaxID=2003697 RepID=UPI00243A5ECC|nr:CPBP family intramembrane glutamic endopeptidase [Thermanaeromonas sp.]MCG0277960.1 CPBP family intramembrane metalloprotease [Thermanaeromonas sp.]
MVKESRDIPPWTVRDSLAVLLLLAASGYGTGFVLRWAGWRPPLAYQLLLAGGMQAVAVLCGVYYLVRFKYGRSLEEVGLKWRNLGRSLGLGLGGGVIIFLIVILLGGLLQRFLPEPAPQPFAELVRRARGFRDLLLPLFIASFLAPITEEVYFRGFFYPVLKARYGTLAGQLGSSLLFAFLHFDLFRFLPLAVGGWGLAYLYERSGSLIAPVVAHGTWNAIMILLLFFSLKVLPH